MSFKSNKVKIFKLKIKGKFLKLFFYYFQIDFLRNFGYLPQKKASTDGIIVHDIHHGDTLINAIKLLQVSSQNIV